ncbi:hypothetical protein [Ferruginivarius sediminum]|nr:hypothetical protein [Ferruginivarius sediminum]
MKRLKRANRDKAHRQAARGHRKSSPPKYRHQSFFTGGKCRF